MPLRLLQRVALASILLLAPGPILDAAAPTGDPPADSFRSFKGQFLVATPKMGDPRFRRTVILMIRHDPTGAFGLIINRRIGEQSFSHLLEAIGEKETAVKGDVPIFYGGPVGRERGYVVHSAEYRRPETVNVDGRMAMTSTKEIVADIARGKGPRKSLIAFGYSGWGPGQLENEMARQDWSIAPADPKLVFDEDRDKVWDAAFARRTREL